MSDIPKYPDVVVQLIGNDGNAYEIIGKVKTSIREVHGQIAANDFQSSARKCKSYGELLQLVIDTVEVE